MNYAQARLLRIPVPPQIGSILLIKSSGECTSPNAQQQRTLSARISFLLCLALMLLCLPVTSLAQPVALTPPQPDELVPRIRTISGPFARAGTLSFNLLERDSCGSGMGR